MSQILMRVCLLGIVAASSVQAQRVRGIQPWVSAGIGTSQNDMSGPIWDMNRRVGGPAATVAGGVLIRDKYVIGVQQTKWSGLFSESAERGSTKVGTTGVVFQGIPTTPLLRVLAGRGEYRTSDELHRGTVVGVGAGAIMFPGWTLSPLISVDASWWINGRAVRGIDAGLRSGNRQISVMLALIAH